MIELSTGGELSTMNYYDSIAAAIRTENDCTFITSDCKESVNRIIKRALTKGWWFVCFKKGEDWHIALSNNIDTEKDLRAKLSNLRFELD
jgi:hypothetical protein